MFSAQELFCRKVVKKAVQHIEVPQVGRAFFVALLLVVHRADGGVGGDGGYAAIQVGNVVLQGQGSGVEHG